MHDLQEQCQIHWWRVAALDIAKENMASRFATSTEEEIESLLRDKDTENTKRPTKVVKELLHEYLR